MLDVGCGDGTFTMILGQSCSEVHGIDLQEPNLMRFREATKNDGKFVVSNMSASSMTYPNEHFDTIVSIETLEHVLDLPGSASEICRVLKFGGELLVTVPNRWFPCENHGMRIGNWQPSRVPFLTYLPWLHHRFALARVFTVRDLDSLFVARGLKRVAVDYLWPTFEHWGNPFQPCLKPFLGLMRKLENSPLRMFGTSIIVRYLKE
jgi:SAM-dependent methyltransferase